MSRVTERGFEDHIEWWLLTHGGYSAGDPRTFDRTRGLLVDDMVGFVRDTQPKAWARLVALHAGEQNAAERFADRVAQEIDVRGTVDVLRHPVIDHGVEVRLAYFRPAHGLTPDLEERYQRNRLTLVRQLAYEKSSNKTIDLGLLVNGIPVATAELKNPLTSQDISHAVAQYRNDRDPNNVALARRAVVHFAVDPDQVKMSTKLAGGQTAFLPFNRGNQGGAGNEPVDDKHSTFYLWENVWSRDAWLDILGRFVHIEEPTEGAAAERRKNRRTIFPRYHQWDAVLNLIDHASKWGPGENYLVQHSAGSGKSNTIGWLAHRLSNLHSEDDVKVFDKIIVITDRLVLDRQLQDTIYQFEHQRGVVVKVEQSSKQLAEALEGERAQIIITTLQKFPFVLRHIEELPADRSYAVIVDEAHSSQTGDAAKELRAVLAGKTPDEVLEAAEEQDLAEEEAAGDPQDKLADLVKGRGRQENLSFFAFTATPKGKTLELFGRLVDDVLGRRYVPFHLYTMRQAIEEGFIHDVLENYTTYKVFYRIEKAVRDDPEYDKSRARAAIARFVSLHPTNLAQKAEIIVEHFRHHTAKKIGGQAKAMVVTASRLHAVRYKVAIDRYIREKGYHDISALVAFSGKVIDDGESYTEANMNLFPESETARRFDTDDYQVLIVAEKFQTGFDQPLLHTMYVDKTLVGLAAVQTLSRLNRIHPGKVDTFVLDFRNDAEDIQKAFAPYYEQTRGVPTDPNLMYDTRRELDDYDVLRDDEIEAAVEAIRAVSETGGHGRVYGHLAKAEARFNALSEDDQDEFREALGRFVSAYRFLAQVVEFTDAKLERDYIYCRALDAKLTEGSGERLDIGSEVQLTHLKVEQTFEGTASVEVGLGEVKSIYDGHGPQFEPEEEHLSRIVDAINERYGLNLGQADELLFEQFEQHWLEDDDLEAQARENDFENFRIVFEKVFMDTIVGRMDQNEEIFKRILDDDELRRDLLELHLIRVYRAFRESEGR